MSQIKYKQGDSYPNLFDTIVWPGSVKTDGAMAGVMIANGDDTGQFTGPLTLSNPVSEGATQSSVDWTFPVSALDTEELGTYRLCLRITHEDGSIETIDINTKAVVGECG